jgi:hypothetical protein
VILRNVKNKNKFKEIKTIYSWKDLQKSAFMPIEIMILSIPNPITDLVT